MKKKQKYFFFLVAILWFNGLWSQTPENSMIISGTISPLKKDMVLLTNGFVNKSLFEVPEIALRVSDNNFHEKIKKLSYPHLYLLSVSSEKNNILYRKGDIFIDDSSNIVQVDLESQTENIDGETYQEYKNRFLPFFIEEKNVIPTASIDGLVYEDVNFDEKLFQYTERYPDSYVALWALIRAANIKGNISAYERTLNTFNDEIKQSVLWINFRDEFNSIRIKDSQEFPALVLKNIHLEAERFEIPTSKYVLVDYWFSRCKPCLESFPKLKEIYDTHRNSGFDIVAVSVDKTKDIPNWKKRITEHNLPWKQYLDEDGVEAKKDNITAFPNNFLLKDGKVIMRKLSPEELEIFLREHVIKN